MYLSSALMRACTMHIFSDYRIQSLSQGCCIAQNLSYNSYNHPFNDVNLQKKLNAQMIRFWKIFFVLLRHSLWTTDHFHRPHIHWESQWWDCEAGLSVYSRYWGFWASGHWVEPAALWQPERRESGEYTMWLCIRLWDKVSVCVCERDCLFVLGGENVFDVCIIQKPLGGLVWLCPFVLHCLTSCHKFLFSAKSNSQNLFHCLFCAMQNSNIPNCTVINNHTWTLCSSLSVKQHQKLCDF